jgi:hypothetical protein
MSRVSTQPPSIVASVQTRNHRKLTRLLACPYIVKSPQIYDAFLAAIYGLDMTIVQQIWHACVNAGTQNLLLGDAHRVHHLVNVLFALSFWFTGQDILYLLLVPKRIISSKRASVIYNYELYSEHRDSSRRRKLIPDGVLTRSESWPLVNLIMNEYLLKTCPNLIPDLTDLKIWNWMKNYPLSPASVPHMAEKLVLFSKLGLKINPPRYQWSAFWILSMAYQWYPFTARGDKYYTPLQEDLIRFFLDSGIELFTSKEDEDALHHLISTPKPIEFIPEYPIGGIPRWKLICLLIEYGVLDGRRRVDLESNIIQAQWPRPFLDDLRNAETAFQERRKKHASAIARICFQEIYALGRLVIDYNIQQWINKISNT